MPVARFNKLSAALADGVTPTTLGTPSDSSIVLVPTERVVERIRAVKEPAEVAIIREAAARLSTVAARVAAFVLAGRSEREIAADIDARCARLGSSARRSRRSSRPGPTARFRTRGRARAGSQHGDGVVLDFGGVYDGYCVDLTRTVAAGHVGRACAGCSMRSARRRRRPSPP